MILKLKTESGWTYIDRIEKFDTFGHLGDFEAFTSHEQLRDAIDHVWGDQREFDREVWPVLEGGERGVHAQSGVARCEGGRDVLVIWADEAFLLSESGDTVDRLR